VCLLLVAAMASVSASPLDMASDARNTGLTSSSSSTMNSAPSIEHSGDDDNDDDVGCQEKLGCLPGIEWRKKADQFNVRGSDDVNLAQRSKSDRRQLPLESPTRYRQRLLDFLEEARTNERRHGYPAGVPLHKTIRALPLMTPAHRTVRSAGVANDEINAPPTVTTWRQQRWWCPDENDDDDVGSQMDIEYTLMETGKLGDTNDKRSSLLT